MALVLAVATTTGLFAQAPHAFQPLANGDTVPDLKFTDVYNHSADTLRLSDYRGKWVILDFWGFHCLPCLKSFPKLDSLQHDYGARVQFITVNHMGLSQVDSFFRRFPNVYVPDIPFITGDTALYQLFPHQGNPHVVWIDPDGRVLQQSTDISLTRSNLDLTLAGKPADIQYVNPKGTYLPTLLDTNYTDEITHGSYLARWNTRKRYHVEKPLLPNEFTGKGDAKQLFVDLYRHLGDIGFNLFQPQRVRLITAYPERFEWPADLPRDSSYAWMDRHLYFYQCRVPLPDSAKLFDWAKSDLERYLGLVSSVDTVWLDTWVLERTSTSDKLQTTETRQVNTFFREDLKRPPLGAERQLINQPYARFSSSMTRMIERVTQQPCFDETGYSGNIDLTFPGNTMDNPSLEKYQEALARYDLRLRSVRKKLPVLMLREQ